MTENKTIYQMAGIGEILWDIFPDGKKLGGSPMNVVYHCQAAGINSTVISAIGKDDLGTEIIDQMKEKQVPNNYMQICLGSPTGTVSVKLHKGIPDFTIHPNAAWDQIKWRNKLERLAVSIDAVAFGSLSQRNITSRSTIKKFLQSMKPESLKIFDVNLRQNFHSQALIESSLELANVLKINDEELPAVAEYLNLKGTPINQLHELISKYSLELVAYTMGSNGSWLVTKDSISEMSAPKVKIVDTVGAGDAFTGVLIAGLLNQKPISVIHKEATDIAAWVCTQQGGTPAY